MKFKKTNLSGVFIIIPSPNKDERGFFQRLFCKKIFKKNNIENSIVQINNSFSKKKGTTRGLHYQTGSSAECKILRCVKGSLVNIVVDVRRNSKTYLKHTKIKLTSKNRHMSYIPRGFANGLQTLEDNTELVYFTTNFYNPKKERGLSIKDPKLKIKLPLPIKIITKKDNTWELLK
ncbi:dTDP-4-dehydrorhamnose 3,5-epimerase family protein [Candidatus Pelagibacter communis]|uniref:dTDP-4-dehydrorhamnose 3,5-epimerase family protein n=1 Tax=Pelagibacter ubique TaxID=198252 RepID=UPI00094C5768|nr:dTDP-4-dehydrorhamnose 3,5-epimerase family protein [Candidatus Pelagibacter ubique]